MYTFIVILILIVCIALALAVLVQNSKGGGLAANFSAPNQVLGVRFRWLPLLPFLAIVPNRPSTPKLMPALPRA